MFYSDTVSKAMQTAINLRGRDFRYGTFYEGRPALAASPDSPAIGCEYTDDGSTPKCIIAWVYVILGLELPTENASVDAFETNSRPDPDDRFSPKALHMMRVAQACQDQNLTWGDALSVARRCVENFDEQGFPIHATTLETSGFFIGARAAELIEGGTYTVGPNGHPVTSAD